MTQAEPRTEDDRTIQVRTFGQLELKNQRGRAAENRARKTFPWLLLKYLLANTGREISPEELSSTLWPDQTGTDKDGNLRVRLHRLREALDPLGLGGQRGLVLSCGRNLFLNPAYPLELDTQRFLTLLGEERKTPLEDPQGLELCRQALELYRAPVFAYTAPALWLLQYRYPYQQGFKSIVQQTLRRMQLAESEEVLHLLCHRAVQAMPEEDNLQNVILGYLVEHQKQAELVSYISQLTLIRSGQTARRPC